jgi:hypothetical protein
MRPWAVVVLLLADVVVSSLVPSPWNALVAVTVCAGVLLGLVLLVRAIRRSPNYVSQTGYESPRVRAPKLVRDEGVAEGTVLPEKRIER